MTELDRYPAYGEAIEGRARDMLPDDVRVDVFGVRSGTYGGHAPIELLIYPYPYHVLLGQVLDNLQDAERKGYDAFILGSYSEPYLREARSLARIPVGSMAESTLLTACSQGRGLGLVTINPTFGYMTRQSVARHGLVGRLAGIAVVDPPVTEDNLVESLAQPDEMRRRFEHASRALIEQHADVIIPAEGVLSEFVVDNGIRCVDGTSVMDSVAVTLLYTHMLVRLRDETGLGPGRRWEYPRPDEEILSVVQRFIGDGHESKESSP